MSATKLTTVTLDLATHPGSFSVRVGGGVVYGAHGNNLDATDRYVMFFDSVAKPTSGQPLACVIAQGSFAWDFRPVSGLVFNLGIWICFSSTANTLTPIADGSCNVETHVQILP